MSKSFSFSFDEQYVKRFQVFLSKTPLTAGCKELLKFHLPMSVREILTRSSFHHGSYFNVLSIGAGTGELDFEIVRIIHEEIVRHIDDSTVPRIFNRAIEPNGHHLKIYEAKLSNLECSFQNTSGKFELCKKTFEEYKDKSIHDHVRFHLVHFMHSLCYLDIESALLHCFDKELNDDGHIVIIETGGKDLMYFVALQLRTEMQLGVREDLVQSLETTKMVMEIIAKHGWEYKKYSYEYNIDVSEAFEEDSIQGNLLLDFLTHKFNYRQTTDKENVQKTLDLIKEKTIVKDGKRLGKVIDEMLMIHK